MEVPLGIPIDKTVTYVQVLTVSDVAEAAALVASEMNQNNTNNQIMQIVTVQTPNSAAAVAAAAAGGEIVVSTSQDTFATPKIETITTTAAAASPADSKTNMILSSNNTTTALSNASSGEDRLCMICGDRANGVHYNVLSCEGCKSFFLRSNRSGATFTCASGGNCNMDLYTRRHCPACRMKRCLECGMKVERVWGKGRLKTRKQLIRVKRKKKVPGTHADSATSPTVAPPTPAPVTAAPTPAPSSTPPQQLPMATETSPSSTPSTSRSSSPTASRSSVTVTPPTLSANPIPPSVPTAQNMELFSNPSQMASSDGGMLMMDLDTPGTSTQTLLTFGSTYAQLTQAQEQLMYTLEKGYNASTEVLKHLSKDVPLFRMTHWSKFKGAESDNPLISQGEAEEDDDMDQSKPKKAKVEAQDSNTNGNSVQQQPEAPANGEKGLAALSSNDPLAVLSSATGQNIEVIYNLTSLATGGQIKDPASALRVLASSAQGLRVIESIGSLVQGQDLNSLISLAKLVGQIIGIGGGSLNDNLADTILGSITGSLLNSSNENTASALGAQLALNTPSASTSIPLATSQDQNGNSAGLASMQDEIMNNAAVAKLASSGLAEALAMLAAMASSSQNKETIVEMVKRAAVSLLKGEDEPQMMSFSSPPTSSSPASNNFYMPTDVGEDEVKTSPFLQSLQRVTSFLTSGKMSAGNKSSTKAKRTVNKEMLHIAMDMFAVLVKQTIHFAKSIPGFTNLSCDDQAVLIKSSIVDALLLRCADNYALDKDCLVNVTNGDKFDVHMMYQLGFSTLPEVVFEFMRDTKACGLTTAEYALFTAAALLSPDRSDLKDKKTVEEMQLEMILALQAATKVFHADKPFLFTKLITKLTTLRDMSILHLSEIMAVKVQEQDLSPLIVELFGLDS